MSQYSETIGSFIRTSNYPLEADYIFESEEQLKEFYQDELNKTLLHKGWFKIVDNGDTQSLYWVVNQEGELTFTKVISEGDINKINQFLEDLGTKVEEEISKREENDADEKSRLAYIEESIKAIVGSEDSVKEYLETLDYKNLTELSQALNVFLNTYTDNDSIDTLPEIKDFLSGYTHTHNLEQVLDDLWNKIEGTPTPNLKFRTLRDIQDFVTLLAQTTKNREDNLQSEINQTQIGVGLDSDGSFSPDQETTYLKTATSVMNALRTLDSLVNQAINNCNIQPKNTSTVSVDIVKEPTKTTISAQVKLSPDPSNDIQAKEDGLYHNIDSEYENGILTIKVNGNVRRQHVLGLSSIVDNAYYDSDQESIIIVFKLQNNDKQTISIPVASLISEWEVDNSNANKVVELTKERVVSGGADKLSADVRLSTNRYNILEKDGNTLLVRGTSDNIFHGGQTLDEVIDQLHTVVKVFDNYTASQKADLKVGDLVLLLNDEQVDQDFLPNLNETGLWVEDNTWWNKLYAYFQYGDGQQVTAWPGAECNSSLTVNDKNYKFFKINSDVEHRIVFNNGDRTQFDGPAIIPNKNYYLVLSSTGYTEVDAFQHVVYYKGLYIVTPEGYKAVSLDEELKEDLEGFISRIDAELDKYLLSSDYTASDILTKIKTVDGTGSELDADTVDGYQASDFMKSIGSVSTEEVAMNANEIPLNSVQHDYRWSNAPYNTVTASILDLSYSPDWRTQLFTWHTEEPVLYTRCRYGGTTWSDWRKLAFTDSNVASATKLEIPHTIWGQSFDGTANVGGSLSGVEDIIFNADAKITTKDLHLNILTKSGTAQGLAVGGLLASDTYPDWSKVPAKGIYSKGDIVTDGAVTATSFVKTGGTATQFLKADGSVDSNTYLTTGAASDTYLPKATYTASDILTKIKTVDGAGSGLDADLLDGVHGKGYMYYNAYNFSNGCLVRLKLLASGNDMVTVHIKGNSYITKFMPIDTWVQFYNFNTEDRIVSPAAIHNGYDFGNINVFCYDGHVYLWFKQTIDYQSFSVYAECTNNPYIGNLVEDITDKAMPTEGVTRLETITPKQSALTTDLSNVLKEDVVDGPVLEEIENLTKEELKAELLGDVDSKLVTKVDKVEGKGLSTNDYTNAEKSKLSALPTATELSDRFAYTEEIIGNSEDIIVDWDDYGEHRLLYIKSSAKQKVFDDLWISAAGSFGTVDHTHTEDGVNKPYYLNEVWMTYEEAIVVYNEYYANFTSLHARKIYGVTNFPPPMSDSSNEYANFQPINAKVINVGEGFLVSQFRSWLRNVPKLTKIIGNLDLQYWKESAKSSGSLKAPALTDVSLYHLHNDFDISSLKSISLSSMQYMVDNSTATSSITVTVHPYVYAKLTGDTTNINPSTKITREVTVEDQIWSSDWSDEQVGFDLYCENLIFEPFDTIIIPDIINPGTNEPIRGTVDRVDTTHKIITVLIEKAVFDEEGELMFNTVPVGSKIMRVDRETSEEELTQWTALVTTANSKNISFATTE